MKIKILRANHPRKWYCGKIGEIFEAAPFSDTEFQTKENGYFIEKSDCVIVNEDGNARCCSREKWGKKYNPKLADSLCGALKLCQDGDFDLGYKIINDVIGQLRKNE